MGKKQMPKNAHYNCQGIARRVWLYCRVAKQDAFALEKQEQCLCEYADQREWNVEGVSKDQAIGTTLVRSGLAELSKAVMNGQMDTVLVSKLSRLCRSTKDLWIYWNFLRKYGVDLYSVGEGSADSCIIDLSVYNSMHRAIEKSWCNSAVSGTHVKNGCSISGNFSG